MRQYHMKWLSYLKKRDVSPQSVTKCGLLFTAKITGSGFGWQQTGILVKSSVFMWEVVIVSGRWLYGIACHLFIGNVLSVIQISGPHTKKLFPAHDIKLLVKRQVWLITLNVSTIQCVKEFRVQFVAHCHFQKYLKITSGQSGTLFITTMNLCVGHDIIISLRHYQELNNNLASLPTHWSVSRLSPVAYWSNNFTSCGHFFYPLAKAQSLQRFGFIRYSQTMIIVSETFITS